MSHDLTLVLGGIASGKSAYAEALAESVGPARLYLATAESGDAEMAAKIAAHRRRRGTGWITLDAPMDAVTPLADPPEVDVILFDCLSMWLSNHLLAESDLAAHTKKLLGALTACGVPVIVVSNEVGLGGINANALARRYTNELGRLNQALAARADQVVQVVAGLPLVLKGAAR